MASNETRAATAPFGAIAVYNFISAMERIANSVRAWNETRRTVAALRKLSPAQLDDIGLTPADVEDFVHKAR